MARLKKPGKRFPILIDASQKSELKRVAGELGITQIELVTRLVKWFVKQDDLTQTGVMGSLSPEALKRLIQKKDRRL